ncbi:MAG TPA: hypothetical protein VJT72_04460, partial [Pseudonocardiaceae bacterium]|nr:hypothetical protein [Pseudonocardiaceae bacterium]
GHGNRGDVESMDPSASSADETRPRGAWVWHDGAGRDAASTVGHGNAWGERCIRRAEAAPS